MHIISVPTVFSCDTPNSGWLNLAQVRQIQTEHLHDKNVAVITWHNGDKQAFTGEDATAIYQAWLEADALIKQRCNCNHRFQNRRQP